MFSSKKEDKTMASAPPPPMQNNQAALRKPRNSAPSIISSDLVVTGTLKSSGDVQIDGRVEGDVQSATLVIGEKAFIQGDVMAEEVTVRGRIEGSIRARKVLLASTCHVQGNILHEAFAVETGAFFEGNCRHADNPLGDDFGKPAAPAVAPAPQAPTSSLTRPATNAPAATFTPLKP
ncbi:cytoskeletal protein CcmA (bactofilin family) [Rhizomicrobium palustre]|jgi:cytoskeletal protein CcmA (bactofilin family)|uniref:Cytoskeletal protein CcmA (Bactofilin family) n=1 Tax=Rhizomicrobium palustre TaxID=189966 RepID=A0A846N2R8_9PROT|nr:polymer-forming cytoskeletal protein [Rhizomicrobium palustre]NIK89417.1 cytoskeletal protein CcmA (bactofilin family) [Rhizomicrobium palustre]